MAGPAGEDHGSNYQQLGEFDTAYENGYTIQVPGEAYPRLHIYGGVVATGNGTVPPVPITGMVFGTTAGTAAEGNDSRITGAAQKSANLSDLASASTARTNLGLGNSATRNVGTTAGTVAAGDDPRFGAGGGSAGVYIQDETANTPSGGSITVDLSSVPDTAATVVILCPDPGGELLVSVEPMPDASARGPLTIQAYAGGTNTNGTQYSILGDGPTYQWYTTYEAMVQVSVSPVTQFNSDGADYAWVAPQRRIFDIELPEVNGADATHPVVFGRATTGAGTAGPVGLGSASLSETTDFDAAGAAAAAQSAAATDATTKANAAQAAAIAASAQRASNLSDLANAATARTNLGLGTAAVTDTGTGAANTILGNDSRLTDTRTPSDSSVTRAKIAVDTVEQLIRTRVETGVTYTSGSPDVTAAAGTFRSSDVGRSVFSDLTTSGAYDPYISPGLVNRINSVLSDGSGATLNNNAIKSGTASMSIGGISASTTTNTSRGLDIYAEAGPYGVRTFTDRTLSALTVRSMMDMGFSHFMSVTVNGATTSVSAPTGIGPAGLLATLYGAVRYTTASPQYGGTVSVLDQLTIQNSASTYGNLLSSVLGYISQPYITASGSGGVVGFTPQLDAGGRIPAVQYWAQPVFTTASSGALNAFPVDSSGFEADTKVNAGAVLGRAAGVKVVYAPIVAQAQVAAATGGLGLGSDLTGMSAATIKVADNSDFPTAGTADVEVVDSAGTYLGRCKFTYTGKTGTTSLTGCTLVSDAVTGYIRAASARILLLATQTTIHSSVGSTDVTTLSASTVKVTSTTGWGSSGTATVETVSGGVTTVGRFTYTSLTTSGGAPALGGCTFVSGVGNFTAGSAIAYGGGVIKEQTGVLIEPQGRGLSSAAAAPIVYGWTPNDYRFRVNQYGGIGIHLGAGAAGLAFTATGYAQTPTITVRRAGGTQHAPTQVLAGDELGKMTFAGYTSSADFGSVTGVLAVVASEDFTASAQGNYVYMNTTNPGTTGDTPSWLFGKIPSGVQWSSVTTGSNVSPVVNFWNGGTTSAKAQTLSSDPLGRLDFYGSTNAANNPYTTTAVARLESVATQSHTATANGARFDLSVIPNNSTTLTKIARLTHNGTNGQVRAEALIVGDATLATGPLSSTTFLTNTGASSLAGAVTAGSTLDVTGIGTFAAALVASGGLYGSVASGGNLAIRSTSHATAGIVTIYDRTTVGSSVAAADAANINTAFSITSLASNDDPALVYGFIKSTTTTTATKTIGKVPFTAGSVIAVTANVYGHRSDTAEAGVWYELRCMFKATTLNGSTPVAITATTTTALATDASVTVAPTLSVVSSEIVVQVKLNATENWSWGCDVVTRTIDT